MGVVPLTDEINDYCWEPILHGFGISMDNRDYAWNAHPHEWMLVADDFHEQLKQLRKRSKRSYVHFIVNGEIVHTWDAVDRISILLMSLTIENAVKAFLVYENPNWVSNGKLAKPLRSHDLVELSEASELLPYKGRYRPLLHDLTEGFETWARYPCGVNSDAMAPRVPFNERRWHQYLTLTQSYGRRMRSLLSKPWVGAHGVAGHFDFSGDFLKFDDD